MGRGRPEDARAEALQTVSSEVVEGSSPFACGQALEAARRTSTSGDTAAEVHDGVSSAQVGAFPVVQLSSRTPDERLMHQKAI